MTDNCDTKAQKTVGLLNRKIAALAMLDVANSAGQLAAAASNAVGATGAVVDAAKAVGADWTIDRVTDNGAFHLAQEKATKSAEAAHERAKAIGVKLQETRERLQGELDAAKEKLKGPNACEAANTVQPASPTNVGTALGPNAGEAAKPARRKPSRRAPATHEQAG